VMITYFETDSSDAALDSELALLHWNYYKRSGWLPNPLFYKTPPNPGIPPVLMTARLDAPKAEVVRALIAAGIKVEAEGLRGKVVIDSGGHLTIDARNGHYIAFDGTLRALADVVRTKTKLPLVFDENREVLPPNSATGVAIYCGWYALQNYTPACSFVEGALGYHIASYELTTLRNPNVRQGDRTTEGVGDIPCPLHTRHAIHIRPVPCLEVPTRPGREPQEAGGRTTPEMVVRKDQLERPARVHHSGGHIALRLGHCSPVNGDPTR